MSGVMRLYQVYDLVSRVVMGPVVTEHNDAAAIRMFHAVCGNPQTLIGQHPADFVLKCLGCVDDQGVVLPEDLGPTTVANGQAWLEMRNREAQAQTQLTLEKGA